MPFICRLCVSNAVITLNTYANGLIQFQFQASIVGVLTEVGGEKLISYGVALGIFRVRNFLFQHNDEHTDQYLVLVGYLKGIN